MFFQWTLVVSLTSWLERGECTSGSPYSSYGSNRHSFAEHHKSEFNSDEGGSDGTLGVDFYDDLHSEFARELEADFGDVSGIFEEGGGHSEGSAMDDFGAEVIGGKEEMYAAYNELHNLAQGKSRRSMVLNPASLIGLLPNARLQSTRNRLMHQLWWSLATNHQESPRSSKH